MDGATAFVSKNRLISLLLLDARRRLQERQLRRRLHNQAVMPNGY